MKPVKQTVLASILARLEEEAATLRLATQAALAAATDEENKPENQYDTRALEASYLAQGQAKRLEEMERALRVLRDFPLRPCTESVASGALVEAKSDAGSEGKSSWFFLLPFGAGVTVEVSGQRVAVLTLESPLGREFFGKKIGDSCTFSRKEYEILSLA